MCMRLPLQCERVRFRGTNGRLWGVRMKAGVQRCRSDGVRMAQEVRLTGQHTRGCSPRSLLQWIATRGERLLCVVWELGMA